jgi:hypothetical protein
MHHAEQCPSKLVLAKDRRFDSGGKVKKSKTISNERQSRIVICFALARCLTNAQSLSLSFMCSSRTVLVQSKASFIYCKESGGDVPMNCRIIASNEGLI